MTKTTVLTFIMVLVAGAVAAGDLYHVTLDSKENLGLPEAPGVRPVARLADGFLVLVENDSDFDPRTDRLVASNVTMDELYLDRSRQAKSRSQHELLFEQDEFRLVRVIGATAQAGIDPIYLTPVGQFKVSVEPAPSIPGVDEMISGLRAQDVPLDSLIGLVRQDSLESYTYRLQEFTSRLIGTLSADSCRDWLAEKFTEFGYDSVFTDTFNTSPTGVPWSYNVVATKVGSVFPNHHVIVGAHRDAVQFSPGADDNGSGTAGVLEMARVLADIETDMTFIFVLFDAEEFGLYGAHHYADEANARGDSIVYMFNMDMIGFQANNADITVYHGSDTEFSELYNQLADSLLGVTGHLSGTSAQSDHYPFQQYGYPVTFLIEYIFSSVYHTPQDSTSYMSFSYFTKIVRTGIATVYTVSATAGPRPALALDFPSGTPATMDPDVSTSFDVNISETYGGILVGGSPKLYYSVDFGSIDSSTLTDVGGGTFQADLPSLPCDSRVEFYVGAEEQDNGMFYYPPIDEPAVAYVATSQVDIVNDNFQTNLGWVATNLGASSGGWQRGVPVDDASWAYDPETDGDGSGMCWLTQNVSGNTDVDGGAVRLTSPIFDMTAGGFIEYYYYLYLTNTSGAIDALLVEVSDDGGGSWTQIARHVTDAGTSWRQHRIEEYELGDLNVDLTANMQFRFTANDDDPQSIVEAGLDGFHLYGYDCQLPWICGDIDGSGAQPDIADLVYMVDYMFVQGPEPPNMAATDVNGDGSAFPDIGDLVYLVSYMFESGPALNCSGA